MILTALTPGDLFVVRNVANLATYPWIKECIAAGSLNLHGWWFDLETGDLWSSDADNTAFLSALDWVCAMSRTADKTPVAPV